MVLVSSDKKIEVVCSAVIAAKLLDLDLPGSVGQGHVDQALVDGGGAEGGDAVEDDGTFRSRASSTRETHLLAPN